MVVRLPKMREPPTTDDWEDAPGTDNTILDPDPYTARVMVINTRFHLIRCEASTGVLGSLKGPSKKIIPGYLEDVCRRKLWIDRVTRTRIGDLLHDIAKWFKSASGDDKAVLRAGKLIVPGGQSACREFAQLVCRLRSDGKMRDCPEGQPLSDGLTPAIVRRAASESQPATVWVPKGSINRLLSELGAPALDLPAITQSLKEEGVLLGEENLGAEPGWLVGGRWWETQQRKFRRAEVAAARTRVRGSS